MARKFKSPQRFLTGDPRYDDRVVAKFINSLMRDGKKSLAQQIFYDAMDLIADRVSDDDPIDVFHQALGNVKPRMEVRSRRVGGANYQVPMEVTGRRAQALAIRWLLEVVRDRRGRPIHESLADALVKAYNKEGAAVSKKITVHKMAEANKAFAHFAW